VHPGWADTPGLAEGLPGFARAMKRWLRDPTVGADTVVWLAGKPAHQMAGGRLWFDRQPRSPYRLPWTWTSRRQRQAEGTALWAWCHRQIETMMSLP